MSAVDRAQNHGTTPVRPGFGFDRDSLDRWLSANVAGYAGPLTIEQFKGGQSNPTYRLTTPRRSYVLRRKPPGQILQGAHAIEREARVLAALEGAGFPVAHVFGLCTDASVIGSWFYVMDHVDGRIVWDNTFPEVERSTRPDYFDAMNATIASLHKIAPAAIGLADYGRPGNYFARQIARWSRQYVEDEAAGRDPGMDRLIEWLPTAIPAGEANAIVHGDFRCDNLMFHPTKPEILAVLDWELSTLGHPLADFAYHALMYRMPPDIVAGLGGVNLAALNIPSEQEYRTRYAERTGKSRLDDDDFAFAVAFNLFRLAAIFHGIKGRVIRGTASSANARERAENFPRLVELAVAAMEECI